MYAKFNIDIKITSKDYQLSNNLEEPNDFYVSILRSPLTSQREILIECFIGENNWWTGGSASSISAGSTLILRNEAGNYALSSSVFSFNLSQV